MKKFLVIISFIFLALIVHNNVGATKIGFEIFPDGTLVPTETMILNQYEEWGVTFSPLYPNSPRALISLDHCLISGGISSFGGDIEMNFVEPLSLLKVGMIGSGLNISSTLRIYGGTDLLETIIQEYRGPTGQVSYLSYLALPGEEITRAIFNGKNVVNPGGPSACIGEIEFEQMVTPPPAPVPEPSTLILFLLSLPFLYLLKKRIRPVYLRLL